MLLITEDKLEQAKLIFARINEDTVRITMTDGWEAEVQDTEIKKL